MGCQGICDALRRGCFGGRRLLGSCTWRMIPGPPLRGLDSSGLAKGFMSVALALATGKCGEETRLEVPSIPQVSIRFPLPCPSPFRFHPAPPLLSIRESPSPTSAQDIPFLDILYGHGQTAASGRLLDCRERNPAIIGQTKQKGRQRQLKLLELPVTHT